MITELKEERVRRHEIVSATARANMFAALGMFVFALCLGGLLLVLEMVNLDDWMTVFAMAPISAGVLYGLLSIMRFAVPYVQDVAEINKMINYIQHLEAEVHRREIEIENLEKDNNLVRFQMSQLATRAKAERMIINNETGASVLDEYNNAIRIIRNWFVDEAAISRDAMNMNDRTWTDAMDFIDMAGIGGRRGRKRIITAETESDAMKALNELRARLVS